MVEPDRPHVTI